MYINESVQSVYCINLDRRSDRWLLSQGELIKLGCLKKTIRFSAIENKNGAVGCMLSHRNIIQMAKNRHQRNILILEDDFVIRDPNKLIHQINSLPYDNFDMFYLGGVFLNSQLCLEGYDDNFFLARRGIYGTFGLIINERIFDFLLSILPLNGDLSKYRINNFDEIYANIVQPYFKVLIGRDIYLEQRQGYSDISLGAKGLEYSLSNRLGFLLAKKSIFFVLFRRILFYLRYKVISIINFFGGKIIS